MRTLVAIPVFNEQKHIPTVLASVLAFHQDVVVIDDGSSDQTPFLLPYHPVDIIRHTRNRGYGSSLADAFHFAAAEKFDWLITMDCDEQHEPSAIPTFIAAAQEDTHDIISGSRYLLPTAGQDRPPPERRAINATITAELNCRLGSVLGTLITDSFCGYKAYRVSALKKLRPTVKGYAFPMQFWVQAAAARLRTCELPVRLIYNDLHRTFGATLDDPQVRLAHYRKVLYREIEKRAESLPRSALMGVTVPYSKECCEKAMAQGMVLPASTRHACDAPARGSQEPSANGCHAR